MDDVLTHEMIDHLVAGLRQHVGARYKLETSRAADTDTVGLPDGSAHVTSRRSQISVALTIYPIGELGPRG